MQKNTTKFVKQLAMNKKLTALLTAKITAIFSNVWSRRLYWCDTDIFSYSTKQLVLFCYYLIVLEEFTKMSQLSLLRVFEEQVELGPSFSNRGGVAMTPPHF